MINFSTGEQRHVCPHDDCDYKTHNPSLLTLHRKKCHGHLAPAHNHGTPSATESGWTQSSSQPPAEPQPSGLFYQFKVAPMQPQPIPPPPMQSYLTQYQAQSAQYQPQSSQYQPQSSQSQPLPPIHNPLGVLYGPADTADDYTMYTAPAMASHGWTEGCICPELMQRRPSEMPGYEYRRY
jgi:hypothetical protein